ncbi:MAG: insulinase family protein, partial [Bacteroidota bacterium]|nr:insulinase family protein [Bacteroidota bacterium]
RVEDNGVEQGLKAALTEVERAKRFGFTQPELDRAKKSITMMYDRAINENDKSLSDGYASELIRHFLVKEPIPGIAFEAAFAKNQLPLITLDEINEFDNTFLRDSDRAVIVTGPEKEGVTMPTEQRLREIVDDIAKTELQPYVDKAKAFVWPGDKPTPGKVVKETKDKANGMTVLTLSNGVKVWMKPTDFKNDEVYVAAYSKGGNSLVSDSDYYSALYAGTLLGESGIANLTKDDMVKAFAGKDVSVKPFLNTNYEGVTAKGTPKDLETLFQLTNLYFTQAKIDSLATSKFISKTKVSINALKQNPQKFFGSEVAHLLSCNHPRGGGFLSDADFDKINYKRAEAVLHDRFANAADFAFVVVGSFDMDKTKSLLETYIASLPANSGRETCKDLGIRPPKGNVEKTVRKGTDPKCMVQLNFTGTGKFTAESDYLLKAMNDVLTINLMGNLREEKSGTYSVGARGQLLKYPYEHFVEHISFQCRPENAEKLIQAALSEVDKLRKNGVEADVLNKVKVTQKNDLEVNLKDNAYWTTELTNDIVDLNKIEPEAVALKRIEHLSSKQIQQAVKTYFGQNYAKAVLYPETTSNAN